MIDTAGVVSPRICRRKALVSLFRIFTHIAGFMRILIKEVWVPAR